MSKELEGVSSGLIDRGYLGILGAPSIFSRDVCFVQICERSLTGAQNGPTMPPVQSFVRAEMFPSGYLIRPCEGGGCIIHVVDHVDYEVCSLYIPM
jgi:hypothetical protein